MDTATLRSIPVTQSVDKRHLYATAYVKGLNRCCVALTQYDPQHDRYLCLMPFGTHKWMDAAELERFCL